MNRVTVEEWIAELESGRWVPAYGQLGEWDADELSKDRRCCLGVLCEMTGVEVESWGEGYPPEEVLELAPWLAEPYRQRRLRDLEEERPSFIERDDLSSAESVAQLFLESQIDCEFLLGYFTEANDNEFRFGHATHAWERPKDFGAVVTAIREWYGL